MLDRIVIVGAGRTASSLVTKLTSLAPVLIIDTASAALDELLVTDPEATSDHGDAGVRAVTKHHADGTSRFVLEDARGDARHSVALVAAVGDDRKNLEICRLARELAFQPVVGIVIDAIRAADYEALGARAIVRATILGQVVERALRHDGLATATTVGQGRGEIVEFVVLPGSPAIGVEFRALKADGWHIAATYRGDELLIPTGKTVVLAEDRLLLVGQPELLPGVVEQLRLGLPMFPLRHGKSVLVYLPGGRDRAIEREAEVLTIRTRAARLIRAYPGAERAETIVEESAESELLPHQRSKVFEDLPLEGEGLDAQIAHLRRRRPGVVVTQGAPRPLWSRVLGRGGPAATLCNRLGVPVLFPHGAPHYTRVIHALIQGMADMAPADAAIDLARMLSLPLIVARVTLPAYFGTPDPETDEIIGRIERRTQLYGLRAETLELKGNPVRELLRLADPGDLFVVSRRRTTRDSFTSPDVALRIAASAACSILVWTLEGA